MKNFKLLGIVSIFFGCAFVNVECIKTQYKKITRATQKKIEQDSVLFFDLLNKEKKISLDALVKKSVLNLYVKCKENDLAGIKENVKALAKEEKAEEVVVSTLLFAINRKDKVAGTNLLGKRILRKFIFDALANNNQVAINLLCYSIDLGTDKHAFAILKELFSRIFLIDEDNDIKKELPEDGLEEQFSKFFKKDDCYDQMQFLYGEASERNAHDLIEILGKVGNKFNLNLGMGDEPESVSSGQVTDAIVRCKAVLEEAFAEPAVYLDQEGEDSEDLDELERAGFLN